MAIAKNEKEETEQFTHL